MNIRWIFALWVAVVSVTAADVVPRETEYFPNLKEPTNAPYSLGHFSNVLLSFEEPPLLEISSSKAAECYRAYVTITEFPSHVIRIVCYQDGTATMIVRTRRWIPSQPAYLQRTKNLSPESVAKIRAWFSKPAFWQAASVVDDEPPSIDGSPRMLEALVGGRYHAVIRGHGNVGEGSALLVEAFGGWEELNRPWVDWRKTQKRVP
jgi:hypothetical protein